MKSLGAFLLFVSLNANAKVYLNAASGQALAYKNAGDKVNVMTCTALTAEALLKDYEGALSQHCQSVVPGGISLDDISRNLGRFRSQEISRLERDSQRLRDTVLAQGGDLAQVEAELQQRRSMISNLKAPDFFRSIQIESALPLTDLVESEDLNVEIAQIRLLSVR